MYRGRTNAPLSSLTTLESERESKLRKEEEIERLGVLGQRSESKAAPEVKKDYLEREKKEREEFNRDLETLTYLTKHIKGYFRYLVSLILKYSKEEGIPKKYTIDVSLSDKGVIMKIAGTRYQAAFKPSGLPPYDIYACKLFSVRLGNTIAKLEGHHKQTQSGILIPDEEDLANLKVSHA